MSSLNPAWLIAEAVATELTAAFANPTAILADADFGTFSPQSIAVIAPGAEENRPGIGARSWVNIYVPEDTPMTWETGNSYLAKPNIRVSVFVEETKRLRSSLHETCLSLSHFITVCLTRSTLNNVARRAPRQTGSTTHKQKGETQTWVSEIRLEYEYQGRGGNVNWPSLELGHDFGTVYLTATETRTLIIHNPGTGTLAVSSITVPDWITAGALPATVAAGASEEVTLTLDTSEAGTYTGDVVLATSAGTITTPVELVVSSGTPPSTGTVCVMGLIYASITTAEAATWTGTLRVRNDGESSVSVESVVLPDGFSEDTPLPASIGAGETESLIVSLTAAEVGTYTGDIVVTLDDGAITFPITIQVTAVPTATVAFTTPGADTWTVPAGVTSIQVLVVGGGGGGGYVGSSGRAGGGGGAGGVVYDAAYAVTPTQEIPVFVGAGGAASTNGANSSFGTLTALGGGGGQGNANGLDGGSGGGGGGTTNTGTGGSGLQPASASGGFGNNGGTLYPSGTVASRGAGGGGGAGAVGSNGAFAQGGNGGVAKDYSAIFGTSYGVSGWFAGGGGGAPGNTAGSAGTGGGGGAGNGAGGGTGNGQSAIANTGSGGGGGVYSGSAGTGGSGVVLIRYEE
jgi:hypothetical protein